MIKKHPHTPPHIYLDNTPYFLTGAIYQKRHLLVADEIKELLLEKIQHFFNLYQWELHHWVILDNHYHVLGKSKNGKDLSWIMEGSHGSTSSTIQKKTIAEKPIWWNYWDYCPRDGDDYNIRLNYLFWNPINHGYVKDLNDYKFSSFENLLSENKKSKIEDQFRKYPNYRNLVLRETEDNF